MNANRTQRAQWRGINSVRAPALRAMLGLAAALALSCALAAGPSPDPVKGKQIAAQVCAACHNADGNSVISTNPKLAGQGAEYIVKQLTDLAKPAGDKTGRENPVMSGFAAALSAQDRLDVAAWFASQTTAPGTAANAEAAELGQQIYRAGIPEKAVPACAGCHGPTGAGLPIRFPRIGSQHADYVESQLRAFREGSRRNSSEVMEQIAFRLSDPDIKALASFVSGLRVQ